MCSFLSKSLLLSASPRPSSVAPSTTLATSASPSPTHYSVSAELNPPPSVSSPSFLQSPPTTAVWWFLRMKKTATTGSLGLCPLSVLCLMLETVSILSIEASSSSLKANHQIPSSGPKLRISAENEDRLRRLLLNTGRTGPPAPEPIHSGLSKNQKVKKLNTVYEKLSCKGFVDDQIELALSSLRWIGYLALKCPDHVLLFGDHQARSFMEDIYIDLSICNGVEVSGVEYN